MPPAHYQSMRQTLPIKVFHMLEAYPNDALHGCMERDMFMQILSLHPQYSLAKKAG